MQTPEIRLTSRTHECLMDMVTEASILQRYRDWNTAFYGGKKPTPRCVVFADVISAHLEPVRLFDCTEPGFELVVPRFWNTPLAGSQLILRFLSTLN